MPPPVILVLSLWAIAVLGATPVCAQDAPPPLTPTMDVGDLWRIVRKRPPEPPSADTPVAGDRSFIIAPTIGSKPDTGVTFGVAGNIASHRGDPNTTHISTSVFGLSFSTKGQTLANIRFGLFGSDDRWLLVGDNRFQWTSQDTFGFGTSTTSADEINARYDFFRIYETMYRRVGRGMFVGGGFHFDTHRNIGPNEGFEALWDRSAFVDYSTAHGFPLDSATSSGFSVAARYDDRDNQIDPRRGWFANTSYTLFFEGFLGGDSNWQQIDFDLRVYRSLTANGRHRLAGWGFGEFVTGGVAPYYHLPATGMDTFGRSGRGYQEGRFRGDQLVYAETEYRTTLTANGLVGFVVFVNATTTSAPDGGEALFHAVAVGGGFGTRLLLSKRSRTNLCLDFGWGRDGSRGVYLAVQEAF